MRSRRRIAEKKCGTERRKYVGKGRATEEVKKKEKK